MDAWEIKEALRARIDNLLLEFLPGGRRDGRYYRTSGVHGGDGNSCVVHLSNGAKWKVGDFYENAPDGSESATKGSILDLFMAAQNITDNGEGFKLAKQWCGIFDYAPRKKAQQNFQSPKKVEPEKITKQYYRWPVQEDSVVGKYLISERGIPLEILRKYNVCEAVIPWANENKDGEKWLKLPTIVFEFYTPDGEYKGAKFLAVERTQKGGKRIRSESGMTEDMQQLWGLRAIDNSSKELCICEGEIDAMSAATIGLPAVSIPFGAKGDGQMWIQNNYEWLEKFELIKVCMDADEAGRREAKNMLPRLNVMRCAEVEIFEPFKDCNDLYLENPEFLKSAFDNAKDITPERLKRPKDYAKKIWDEFFPPDGLEPGDPLPFNCPEFRLRSGEVTVWTGYPKHGKTNMLNWVINCVCAMYKRKAGVASLEIKPEKTLRNLIRQAIGKRKPTDTNNVPDKKLFRRAIRYLDNQFFVFDCVGRGKLKDVLDTFTFAVRKYGLDHVIIDSFMKLDVAKDDLQRQSDVMDELCTWARDNNVHVHLVAHSRKPQNKDNPENHIPRPDEVEGSGDITKQAHNCIVVYRNKKKESALAKATAQKDWAAVDEIEHEHDAVFYVRLQREGDGEEPMKHLHFDRDSWQYGEEGGFTALNLIDIYENGKA